MSTPEEEDDSSHFQLLKSLERTFDDGRREKKHVAPTRTEARKDIGEFGFNSAPTSSLSMDAILQSFYDGETDKNRTTKTPKSVKQVVSKEKSKTLPKPLEKPLAEKINRTVLYDNLKKEISKWNAVVYHNRTSDQLVFPLSASKKAPRKTTKAAVLEFVPETPLEEEMARILHGADYVKKKKAEIHEKEPLASEQQTYAMTVAEAMEKHNEMARLRALQSYEQIKAKRQSKIKSKKYHRLLRREKIRKQLKEFEQLQKTDPEAALLKLEELDKARVKERMSLKHRNTSKWAKMHAVRAKYDKESRSALSDQLKISRELTKKVEMEASDEEIGDDDYDLDIPSLVKSSLTNPWVLSPSVKDNEKVHLYYTGYKKFWQEVNERKEKERQKKLLLEKAENPSQKNQYEDSLDAANSFLNENDNHVETEPISIEAIDGNEKQIVNKVKSISTRQKKLQKRNKLKQKIESKINEYVESKIVVDKDDDVTGDLLDNIMDAAEDKLKMKALTHLEVLGKIAKKNRKSVEKKSQLKRKPKTMKGDAGEVRELNVDESEKNYEESTMITPGLKVINENVKIDSGPTRKDTNLPKSQNDGKAIVKKTIDPTNFLQFERTPTFDMDAIKGDDFIEDQPEDPEEERLKIIAEAFEDDDLLEEFKRNKQVEVEANTPKDINLALPGWGDWGGKDIKPNLRKRKRFLIKAPPAPPRKDALLSHVMLNEDANSKLKPHQVRSLPFPFKRVQDFEKMIRAPVGRNWLPEPAMKSLIAPKIITRLGAVIQPIDEDALVSKTELKAKELQLTGVKRFPKRKKFNLKNSS